MNREWIEQTERFLKDTFAASAYLDAHPEERDYRLEHSYRVANIGREIAEQEGFPVADMVIACLLHDIAYREEMPTREARMAHGRRSAQIARPFLEGLGLPEERMQDILYGIAIHVDDQADFAWRRTAFSETVGDADNIDRFDAYRIYETLEYQQFSKLPLEQKRQRIQSTLTQLSKLREMKLGTAAAEKLWQERIDFYISFYEKLEKQMEHSQEIR